MAKPKRKWRVEVCTVSHKAGAPVPEVKRTPAKDFDVLGKNCDIARAEVKRIMGARGVSLRSVSVVATKDRDVLRALLEG